MATQSTVELSPWSEAPAQRKGLTELQVTGMTCGHCAQRVTEAIQSVAGVESATVSLEAGQAQARWRPDASPDVEAVIKAIEKAGYKAGIVQPRGHDQGERKLAGWQLNIFIGVPGVLLLMLGEWVFGLGMESGYRWFSFAIAGIVQVFAGARFYRGAWGQLKAGSANMDMLVALGSTTAFAYSAWALLSGQAGHLYFMEAAAIIALISVGHWMESRVSVRASSALRGLLNLAPALARRLAGDGLETEVPVAALRARDLVVLRPGDRVPTDGEVVEGDSAVDESMLTGESAPVDKTAGNPLYAGTANANGRLVMRVTATGEETALAHIIAAVQRAQSSRAHIQRLGDRVSSVFVPVVVALALAAGLWWGLAPESARLVHAWLAHFLWSAEPPSSPAAAGFIIAAAVLIIACPCAMGLATPAAIMAGSNAAAQRGILIRDGVALEKAGKVTAVLFDKTGTLTAGKPQVAATFQTGDGSRQERSGLQPAASTPGAVPLAAAMPPPEGGVPAPVGSAFAAVPLAVALARPSAHPISQAVARLPAETIRLEQWEEVRGAGVKAAVKVEGRGSKVEGRGSKVEGRRSKVEVHGREVEVEVPGGAGVVARLGSLRWLEESGVDLAPGRDFTQEWSAQGATIVGVAVDRTLLGLFAIRDLLKPGAREVVDQLRRQGLKTWLVTGDNALTAASIARQAGIAPENALAEVRPEQKAELVGRLQRQGERVAFVGDGINDAPALEQADLGIAVSRASDVAREAADIILLKSEIEAVPESLGLARATLRTIKQNLFWAFFYNAIGIPLAALGFMSPILCAAAMGLSDLVVIGNALRLRRWKLSTG
jgi:Cu+-exporting ATPase